MIHKHCLYWKVFSTDIYRKIFFNSLLLFSYICWSVNCMSWVSKFHNFFLACLETEARFILEGFKHYHLWKVQFQLSRTFLAFFIWSINSQVTFLVTFCWSVNSMSWVFGFRGVQKLKHYIWEILVLLFMEVWFVLFVPIQTLFRSVNCTSLICKLCLLI